MLISILTAFHEGVFTINEVQAELQMLFEKQYILTQTVEVEVRYRTETRTDSEGNDYDVEVPYNYYICKVKLENFDLSHVPVYIMDEETLSLYAVYMATLGNREDLFPGSGYVDKYTKPPTTYDIPPSALEDEPLRRSLPRRRSTSDIPMSGAAAIRTLLLIAPASYPGC